MQILVLFTLLQSFVWSCINSTPGHFLYPLFHASIIGTPTGENKHSLPIEDLKNWDYTISYDVGSASPLSPSFNFSLELLRSTQVRYSPSLLLNRKSLKSSVTLHSFFGILYTHSVGAAECFFFCLNSVINVCIQFCVYPYASIHRYVSTTMDYYACKFCCFCMSFFVQFFFFISVRNKVFDDQSQ
jgi:hypothetical protein